ncbi:MAG: SatD family protein [Actinomycetota bacterium]|nr:SatD family protein [Actinomycetota bacterium]
MVNSILAPVQELEPTVGDEFQGVFENAAAAAHATLLLRLQLLKDEKVDSRYGLGFGGLTVFEERTPLSQDGPAWWAARAAIDRVGQLADGHMGFARTWFEWGEPDTEPPAEARSLNSFLICRDALIEQMRPRHRRLLLGLLLQRPQAELALEEGISQPAVSQGLARSGAYAVRAAEYELSGVLG